MAHFRVAMSAVRMALVAWSASAIACGGVAGIGPRSDDAGSGDGRADSSLTTAEGGDGGSSNSGGTDAACDASADACPCDLSTCPTGCCDGTTCLPYPSQTASTCGTGGAACRACDSSAPICSATSLPPNEAGGACSSTGTSQPSCTPGGDSVNDCPDTVGDGSAFLSGSCCISLEVPGGTFYRTYTPASWEGPPIDAGPTGQADPAAVSGLRMDKYLVTVGRFRQFVAAWNGGWIPPSGSGKHTHLNGGKGLAAVPNVDAGQSYESGWDANWNSQIAPTTGNLLSCGYNTWTPSPTGSDLSRPINCVTWYEAYAFCIWDGGFLPSEAEWEYVAAGGNQQRDYPWGSASPRGDGCPGHGNCMLAIFGCRWPDGSGFCDGSSIPSVGTAAGGAGLWGQLDMAGEMWEWTLDEYASYVDPCTDCAYLQSTPSRVIRGGSFWDNEGTLPPPYRADSPPASRGFVGLRCARTP